MLICLDLRQDDVFYVTKMAKVLQQWRGICLPIGSQFRWKSLPGDELNIETEFRSHLHRTVHQTV